MQDGCIDSPCAKKIKKDGIVRLVCQLFYGWMRPVAAPNHAFRRCFDERSSHCAGVCVIRRADLRIMVGAGYFHPCTALIDQCQDSSIRRMIYASRLGHPAKMIEYD